MINWIDLTLNEIIIGKKGGVAKLNHINGNRVASVGEKVKRFQVHMSKDRVGGPPITRDPRTTGRPDTLQSLISQISTVLLSIG